MRFIRHVKKPGWGVGRVLEDDREDVLVFFEAVGPKKLRKAVAELEEVPDSDVGPSDLLRHVKADAKGKYAAPPLTFEEMVQNFLRIEEAASTTRTTSRRSASIRRRPSRSLRTS